MMATSFSCASPEVISPLKSSLFSGSSVLVNGTTIHLVFQIRWSGAFLISLFYLSFSLCPYPIHSQVILTYLQNKSPNAYFLASFANAILSKSLSLRPGLRCGLLTGLSLSILAFPSCHPAARITFKISKFSYSLLKIF